MFTHLIVSQKISSLLTQIKLPSHALGFILSQVFKELESLKFHSVSCRGRFAKYISVVSTTLRRESDSFLISVKGSGHGFYHVNST
jgi:hypothetical protein